MSRAAKVYILTDILPGLICLRVCCTVGGSFLSSLNLLGCPLMSARCFAWSTYLGVSAPAGVQHELSASVLSVWSFSNC